MVVKKRILVVDDEQQLALAIKIRLESKGYQVEIAADGKQAMEKAETNKPDMVILDVLMPIVDGYTCLRNFNQHFGRGKIPVIILTARERMKDLFELEGIEDYVVKPFDHDDLLIRIDRVLKRRAEAASKESEAKKS